MDLASLLANFGAQNGLGSVELDARGSCRLAFNNRWFVDVQLLDDSLLSSAFLLRCSVGSSQDLEEKALRRLLSANLFAFGPYDAVVALDSRHDEVVLIRRYECNHMNHTAFLNALTEFVNQASYWGELLQTGAIEKDDVDSESSQVPSDAFSQQGGFLRA